MEMINEAKGKRGVVKPDKKFKGYRALCQSMRNGKWRTVSNGYCASKEAAEREVETYVNPAY